MVPVQPKAPLECFAVEYDRSQLSLYAALLDAEAQGLNWREAACGLMGIDADSAHAHACWQSHLDRAHWIVGDGLASALDAFGRKPTKP